ncbi:hypothetical protein, partial [Escherichia coli]|uniref:hypothetical protein n=1 Tax=Escherichia coli TaxID=562 RepID=UPI002157AC93
ERGLSLDNMKLCYIILFCGHFCGFVACLFENLYTVYLHRKAEIAAILAIARRLSIFSTHSHAKAPSVVITDVEGDSESLDLDDGNGTTRISPSYKPRKRRWSTVSHQKNVHKCHPAPDFKSDGEE